MCVDSIHQTYTSTFSNTCIFMYCGGGGYSHRGGTPVAPCIDTGLTRSKAASGEGTQTGHVSVCIVQYWEESRYSRMYWYRFEYWANEGTRHRKRYMTMQRYDTQRYKTTQCTEYNGRDTVKIHIQKATIHERYIRSRGYKTDFEGKRALPLVLRVCWGFENPQ